MHSVSCISWLSKQCMFIISFLGSFFFYVQYVYSGLHYDVRVQIMVQAAAHTELNIIDSVCRAWKPCRSGTTCFTRGLCKNSYYPSFCVVIPFCLCLYCCFFSIQTSLRTFKFVVIGQYWLTNWIFSNISFAITKSVSHPQEALCMYIQYLPISIYKSIHTYKTWHS